MENSASYWKELYFKVYSENRQLRIELESLKQEYNAMKEKYKTIKSQKSIEYLQKPKNEIKIFHSVDLSHIKAMAETIVAPKYDISQQKDSNLKKSLCFNPAQSGKKHITEAPTDIPVTLDADLNPDLFLFEELFILSVSSNFKSSSVKGRYPNDEDM